MANLFKLNKSQRRFFTCWGKLHVKMAFLVIILVTLFAEILETVSYVMVGWHQSSLLTYAIEIWEYIVTISMIIAFIQENAAMMLPFVGQMFVVVVMMLIMFFQLLFCALVPYSSLAEQFFSDGHYTLVEREKKLLSILITVGLFTFVAGWFLRVALATYQYFDYMSMKKARRAGRANNEQVRNMFNFYSMLSRILIIHMIHIPCARFHLFSGHERNLTLSTPQAWPKI
ncbi:hypothetical protein ANCCAN_28119 [Ancylostoma caninum]|uniref:Uncharacterized protein n=1 Tax=Ancylostoma caninum TaxID=29170 RepID=A0A368F237_ANCCA|nr:hypothetical protein ANCCAN_28119 [Ancylostoma caninum]